MVVCSLLFLFHLVLSRDRQHPVLQGDVHIVLLEPRKLGTDHQVVVLGEHVHSRRPHRELLISLAPASATQTPQHLVEEAIDLTLRIVKPTKWTQHDPCTSFSLCIGPSKPGTKLPTARTLYTLSHSFQTASPKNVQIFSGYIQ